MPKQLYSNQHLSETARSIPPFGILDLWQRVHSLPLPSFLTHSFFNLLIAKKVPYTGTVKPRVTHLEPGLVRVEMKDRKAIRNHLNSIHAIALANVGEFSSGLAMLAALPDSVKAIVTHLDIDFKKKARGSLMAEGRASPPVDIIDDAVSIAHAVIYDAEKDVVAEVSVTWRLRLKESSDHQTNDSPHQKAVS